MTMSDVPSTHSDRAQYIVHPTDFSPQSEIAFAYALRLALANKANLTLLHVGEDSGSEWDRFPSVRPLLEKWGLLEAGSRRADIAKLGIGIDKIVVRTSNVVNAIVERGRSRSIDLLVLSTEQRRGLAAWLQPSTAEKVARELAVPTLFVPDEGRGCLSLEDGQVTLDQILIPVDHDPPVDEAIERGLRAIVAFGNEQSKLTLLHVGPDSRFPSVRIPKGPWQVTRMARQGNPVTEILAAAEESKANLLIMVTQGSKGFLDAWRGTTTEQVLRRTPCPILTIPSDS